MKSGNQIIYSLDKKYLERLEGEFKMLGRDTKRLPDRLIVYAYSQKKIRAKEKEKEKATEGHQKPKERH